MFHALKKSLKCLVHVAVGFRHHKIGVPQPNPEFISVPWTKVWKALV